MIIDDSRNVLAHLKAELHEESAVKASADMNIGDIVYLESKHPTPILAV